MIEDVTHVVENLDLMVELEDLIEEVECNLELALGV